MEWEEEERKKKIIEEAKQVAEEAAKDYIDKQKWNLELEVDKRSIEKALKDAFRKF